MKRKTILLKAPLLTRSGYGEQARFALRALRSREDIFDIYVQPLQWGQTSWINEITPERIWIDNAIEKTIAFIQSGKTFDMSLQVTIPNEWEKIAPINIGYTAGIETTKVDHRWILAANEHIDRIIVVSNHSRDVYKNTSYAAQNEETGQQVNLALQKPIETVSYPVKNFEALPEIDLVLEHDFNFLCVAQWGPRKNLHNTIKWFVEEFKDEEVGLVVKTNLMKNCHMDRLQILHDMEAFLSQYKLERKCKIYLLHGDMTDEEMHALYVHPKVSGLISLAHGEGFGLPLFEAAYSGLPVVATGWSGQMDFLRDESQKDQFYNVSFDLAPIPKEVVWDGVLIEDSMWAYAREESAKEEMRRCHTENKDGRQERWLNYADDVKQRFSDEVLYEKFLENVLGEKLVKVNTEDLPKISIITSVYNGDKHIHAFLEDITNQSIFEEKCELVLINANSPGNEEEAIKEYQQKYPDNIIYKKLDEDPGIYGTWNLGLELSSGDYLTNANLDDRRSPLFMETLAKQLYGNDEVDLIYADNYLTLAPNETFENNSSSNEVYPSEEFSIEGMLRGNSPHCMPMWKKTLHESNGEFDSKYRSAGDWEFWLRCAFNGAQFKKYSQPLGLYYFNPEGVSTNAENDTWKHEEEREVFKKYQKLYIENQNKQAV